MNASGKSSGGWRKALKSPFQWFDTLLDRVERFLLIASVLAMATVSMISVISRNIGQSISWGPETAQLLVVVVTFVGLGHGVRMARHIRVSAIHDLLPEKGQKALLVLISFSTSALLVYLGFYSMDYVMTLMDSGRLVPSLRIPIYYVYIIAPIGIYIAAVQYFLAGVRNLISRDTYLSWQHRDEYEEAEEIMATTGLTRDAAEAAEDYDRENDRQNPSQKGGTRHG